MKIDKKVLKEFYVRILKWFNMVTDKNIIFLLWDCLTFDIFITIAFLKTIFEKRYSAM